MEAKQISTEFIKAHGHLKVRMIKSANVSVALLKEAKALLEMVERNHDTFEGEKVRFISFQSSIPGIFNLGGDLELFVNSALAKDRETLQMYGDLCIDVLSALQRFNQRRVITLSLVQGHAYGGGFEFALGCQFLIAEKQARMGMPEVKFNLFPGMGGYSFLRRRIGARLATKMLLNGEIHSAAYFHRLGIVDKVVAKGSGELALDHLVKRLSSRLHGITNILSIDERYAPIREEELRDIVNQWVDAALDNSTTGLRLMKKLYMAQKSRVQEIVEQRPSTILKMRLYEFLLRFKPKAKRDSLFDV